MYTKGEWIAYETATNHEIRVADDVVADVYSCHTGTHEANAHLIAQAPRMYEALKRILDSNIIEDGRIVERTMPTHGSIYAAAEAIAKAGGKL